MNVSESPQFKAVRHFERAIDTKKPDNHKLIYDWVSSLIQDSHQPGENYSYQGNPADIIDKIRTFPFIGEVDNFFKSGYGKNFFDDPLSQYQTNDQWNHEEHTLDNLKIVIGNNGSDVQSYINLAIKMFEKSGNIKVLTNFFYYAEMLNLPISPQIQLEALFWAEMGSAKVLLEQENNSRLINIIRVSDVKKRDEGQKFVERDPVLHLFRAYKLIEMMEAIN